jgi:hypothetical protein
MRVYLDMNEMSQNYFLQIILKKFDGIEELLELKAI